MSRLKIHLHHLAGKIKFISVAVLVIVYERLEYLWYPFEHVQRWYTVPFIVEMSPIKLDSMIYMASVKAQHFIFALILHVLLPLKFYTRWMIVAFAIAFFELFLTYNEPIFKLMLPSEFYIPVSTATLKATSVCYFLYGCVKHVMK